MYLTSLELSNIRSYEHQVIQFPTGSFLLAGDIGSGKSTILLAIEFALFGAKPSELPASSLLRHGENQGFVMLTFNLQGKKVIIKRTLKRGKQGIKQESGYLIIDEVKQELSPVELKSEMFSLLGYPEQLVGKGKDLIYKYTVYTPQEEMKRILYEDVETRLNTLRTVFNIDKYKRIKENIQSAIRSLKEKQKELQGRMYGKEEKEKDLANNTARQTEVSTTIATHKLALHESQEAVNIAKDNAVHLEQQAQKVQQAQQQVNVFDTKLATIVTERERNALTVTKLTELINSLQKEVQSEPAKDTKKNVETLQKQYDELQALVKKTMRDQGVEEAAIKSSEQLVAKINDMSQCPVCLQEVVDGHKHAIRTREQEAISTHTSIQKKLEQELAAHAQTITTLEKERDQLREMQSKQKVWELKKQNLKSKEDELTTLTERQALLKKEVGSINVEKQALNATISEFANVQEQYKAARKAFEEAQTHERNEALLHSKLETELKGLQENAALLEKDIAMKEQASLQSKQLTQTQDWLEKTFVNLMDTMEKHVMMQVYHEFNAYFTEWFNTLLEEPTISVRLSDTFAPIVEQNGYETLIENLSGGEKTAVALAYRLALHKVINELVSTISTKDIIMLDEPTDGFSTEQLDRVRTVLDQLKIKQTVIVSHEAKIESYVDHIIRVSKQDHVSSVEVSSR